MKTYSIKRNYSSYQTGVFIYKSNSRIKHDLHCIISSLINPAFLNFYFIQHYYLLFSWRNLFFLNVYISVNTIFERLYIFFGWKRGHKLSAYATVGGWGSSEIRTTTYRGGGGVTPYVYVITRTISFHAFDSIFAL